MLGLSLFLFFYGQRINIAAKKKRETRTREKRCVPEKKGASGHAVYDLDLYYRKRRDKSEGPGSL